MSLPHFPQNVIAVIWDFDKTLLAGYMQEPLFRRYGVDGAQFWTEVNALEAHYKERGYELIATDTIYLSHMLSYVRAGRFEGLNNAVLREIGGELTLYEGMPDFLGAMKAHVEQNERFKRHEITVEHYVVSTGLRQTILGSAVAPYVDGVWACEFLEDVASPGFLDASTEAAAEDVVIRDIAYSIDNTTKTRAVFEINKGVNKYPDDISVNVTLAHEDRRVPFENMIYIADGPSDVPVFSILNQYGGKTLGVYDPSSDKEFRQVADLQRQGRIQASGPADYTERSPSVLHLLNWLDEISETIKVRREQALGDRVGKAPGHLV